METSTLQAFIDWFAAHHQWAYFFVFAIAAGESLAVVGMLIPGIALMLGAGTLVGLGALNLWYCLLWATLGAVAGDGISFWLGRRYQHQLKNLWPLNRYPELFPRGEAFFVKHGGKGVLFGRFFGPVRAIIPAVAGMLGMQPLRFYSVNVLSAIAWAPVVILPGVVFGASLSLAAEVTSRLAGLVLGFLLFTWLAFLLARFVFQYLQPRADAMVQRFARLGEKRFVGRVVNAVLDPQEPEWAGLLILGCTLILAMGAFFYFLVIANNGELYFRIDAIVEGQLHAYQMPWLDYLASMVVGFGAPLLALVSGGLISVFLFLRHYRVAAAHWLSALLFAFSAPLLIGYFLSDATAAAGLTDRHFIPDLSLLLTTVITGMYCVMVSRELPGPWRWLPYSVYAVILMTVGFAYGYWRETLFFDVFGGISLGLMAVAVLGIAYRRHAHKSLPAAHLAVMGFILLALPPLWGGLQSDRDNVTEAVVRDLSIDTRDWWAEGWRHVAISKRIAKIRQVHPVTFQWAGELAQIEDALVQAGWQQAVPLRWNTLLYWLAPDTKIQDLPVVPHVHDGFFPKLTLVHMREQDDEISVFRVWPSTHLLDAEKPIWVGNVSLSKIQTRVPLLRFLVTQPDYQSPLRDLHRQLLALPLLSGEHTPWQINVAEKNLLLIKPGA